ncbi:fibronectin type III domain-containing protein 7-like [Colossoma macropomum]|uniref:fibronectin type III domain-containing protein 7-like n=1 Tax=Colossoma macropomum TaxID=42526 RepID=UPI001863D686|nr:fibronectin type III domain-containing protein 7-like [Colossoma macropomum]
MRLLETLCFLLFVALLTEVQQAQGNCDITSITSPSASNLYIKWTSFPGATNYFMDLRVVNSTTVTPVVLQFTASTTEKLVQGLRPGSLYQVTLKVYQFYYVMCISSTLAQTVPAASQITFFKAISSTSITFQWSSVVGADSYVLVVEGAFHTEYHNLTFTSLSGDITGLQPAKTYNCYVYSSNAAGLGAKSSVKTVNTLVQPPGVVTVTTVNSNTVHVTWSSVPGVLLYQVSLTENNRSGLPPVTWNTSATSLNLPNLKPCSSYTIGVSSINMFLQPGEPSTALYTTNSVASVPSISVDYSCTNAIATVNWEAVSGARLYRAVATGNNGTSLSCTSIGTSCQITTLGCGEHYTVRITSIADCESTSNISYTFETAPCPPQNPKIFRECFSNVIIFSWAPTNNTAYYVAQSVDSDGVVNECVTIYTSCYFTQTDCGLTYSFTVSSVYSGAEGCNTGSTLPVTVSTAPCLPQNVRTSATDCLSDTLITTWNPARGALSYTVQARGNRDDFYNCTSQGTNCTMTGVKCGQSLSVWITASNNECMTDFILADVAETVPCAPQDIFLVDTCGSFSITLNWLTSNNAIFYTAKAVLPDGTIRFCNTMNTQCEIMGLQCGQTYEAFVMSTNFICNSTDSQHIAVKTGGVPF